jgi:hypothetical protein
MLQTSPVKRNFCVVQKYLVLIPNQNYEKKTKG